MSKKRNQLNRRAVMRPRMLVMAVLSAMPLLHATVTQAAPFDISNVPLYLGGTLDPNLMYIHDDSGSMYWSFLPDNASSNSVLATSSSANLQYYNPTATYLPPVDHNGDSLGDASFTAAWFDGYDLASRASNVVNLSTSFRATWAYAGSWIGGAQPAYYHQYSPPRTNCTTVAEMVSTNTNCYVKVVVPTAQQQNFANWYSYYRTRVYSAKAGISRAFATLGEGIRVGYGRINDGTSDTIDGKSVPVIQRGVRAFSGTSRQQFFDWLFAAPASGSTPLRRSLDAAGKYFDNDNAVGPWSTTPGVSGGEHLSCRKSFTILMTDGYWNGSASGPALANNDGTSGPSHSGPDDPSYTYSAVSPFTDTYSGTLADVAMYYWKNDLSSLDNRVKPTPLDPAFWQHMSTYAIGFGLAGAVDPDAAFDAITSGATITWGNPSGTASIPAKIDDLLHAGVNSRGGYFSANNPTEFSDALAKTLAAISDATSTASAAVANSTRLDGNTMVYQAKFDSGDWTGELLGYKLDTTTGLLGTADPKKASEGIDAHGARKLFTWRTDAGKGIVFDWDELSGAQQADLGSKAMVNYLRGDKSNEGTGATKFRIRNSALGDIVNSTATFVGTQDFGYGTASGLTASERDSYKTRRADGSYKSRTQMLYFGANDGILHAVQANDLKEVFGYVPNILFSGGHLAALADKDYTHRYYVDGSPRAADARVGGAWRTVLVGSTGAGGRAYFAMDVEDAPSFDKSKVLWEFTEPDVGSALGQASIVRTESGNWVALFGNGYNSDGHTARLFILDLQTGAKLAELDTEVGTDASPNGLSTPLAVDSDLNGNADLVYAGDMYGNLWKFDLSGSNSSQWKIAYKSGPNPMPLFKAEDSGGKAQPITAKPQAARFASRGKPEIIVYFGTGKFFEVGDQGAVSDPQTLYGVVDECITDTSGSCGTASVAEVRRSNLVEQTINVEAYNVPFGSFTSDIRLISDNPITPSHKGFFIDLISPVKGLQGERIVVEPVVSEDRVEFISMIPNPDPCGEGGESWFFALNPTTGGQTKFSPFDLNKDGDFSDKEFYNDGSKDVPVNGRRHPGGIVNGPPAGPKDCEFVTDSGGNLSCEKKETAASGRRSWRQIR
ncbi:MAG: hypothetical protein HYS20_00795 [Rhodocyclales bacterium]|nr:hypothetical protein [Rhodocyclales bacterium]